MTTKSLISEFEEFLGESQDEFRAILNGLCQSQGCLSLSQYVSYLSMQAYLTKGVQKYFFRVAAHPSVMKRPKLRKFVTNFAVEEAPHYLIAIKDLSELGVDLLGIPFSVEVWHAYFRSVVDKKPFLRLGAACYLENVAGKSADLIDALFKGSAFLTPKSMRFFAIHRHESEKLSHGKLILNELYEADLSEKNWRELTEGARKARILYGTMINEALFPSPALRLKP